MPVVNALKDDDPRRRITWVARPMPAEILGAHPAVDRVLLFRKDGWRGVRDLWRQMRRLRFDLVLNLNRYFGSVVPTVFSRARHRVGVDRRRVRDPVWVFCNDHLPPRRHGHVQDLYLEFLDHLGLHDYEIAYRITFTDAERADQAAFFERWGDRPVVSVVSASALPAKDWLPERWAKVIDALEGDFGFRVVLVGGPSAREARLARDIVGRTRAHPVWALGDGVRRLAWILDGSRLVLSPDTGPVHIARALDIPVIGLYGRTNPWRTGPYRKFEDLVVDRYSDSGEPRDPSRTEPRHGRMERITVEDVLERVELAQSRYPRVRAAHS
jgi:heptosyltransferase I